MRKHHSKQTIFGLTELDLWHHTVLIFILTTALFAFLFFSPSKILQFTIGCIAALLYVGWGVLHHYIDGDLHFKNVIEYILFAVLGLVILTGILI
ncbi:MAG: hypothetical protein UU81_C0009G0007 [Microgenomates group bacterium GW2011_GWC1_41_8]|uniref:Uncharacterized protein n=3 Tax=Candidatus Roizmaniibacteriota TaxID=1752723 RepID=A0A0G0XFJ0_9BACT|nr:MAG: hypothetical protein UT85_C0004G0007 [Candidatus Levybacteria bacterium GW2011_GWA2_40_16]KKR72781.1 MAG: hypothetical protein UU14_C0002G0034 [Candidatus Roizmanbacteria bacterium GW2011_GWB1_40_7]KKR94478.1 MAG: hypothetical protein UU41_C0006G0024 [Candidatus Roizmanbacteria bacterium GW2011_GWA1_41_13]KKS23202.1 MAG: hypothetical protein UU78_C0001G0007 [Candidatus Roizmanbacteria bacterium GW2011_GWC2_41_7]KKS24310.1 MAG: hypothetical protein UU81_C0009G0007 [Microgenomates group b